MTKVNTVWAALAGVTMLVTACGRAAQAPQGSSTGAAGGPGAPAGTPGANTNDPSVDAKLVINEIMAANVLTAHDEQGNAAPWIEIYNGSDRDLALGGYALTDDFTAPRKAVLPAALTVKAGGYLLVWCDGNPDAGPTHVAVTLARAGGSLALVRPDGSFITQLTYGPQEVDLSAAREPDGAAAWQIEWLASPGGANLAARADAPGPAPTAVGATVEMVPAAGDVSERILGYDVIPEFELEISPDGIASLRAQPSEWVQATLIYQGRKYGPVGVNLKGTRSFAPIDAKPAFRISLNQYVKGARFFGLKHLTLNNMHTDLAMMHERLAYWVARQVGLPASRANHAMLKVNGEMFGLFANVETMRGEFLSRWFKDANGPLFGIQYADFTPSLVDKFELQSGSDDRGLLDALSTALATPSADAAMTSAATYADVHEFNALWALCAVVGQYDSNWPYAATGESVGGDAYVYADPTTARLVFMPSGMDDTFETADFDFTATASVLPQRCKESPACFQDFVDRTWEMLRRVEAAGWVAEYERVAQQIAPLVQLDTRKRYSNDDVAMYQQQMRYFLTGRRTYFGQILPPPSQ